MKRKLSLLISIIMIVTLILSGCGGKDVTGATGTTDTTKTSNKEEYLIRVAHVLPEEHATHVTLDQVFKKEVEEKSGGRIKVEIYPNGQLGADRQTIEALNLGTLEMCVPGGTVLSGFVEDFMVLDLPFLFKTKEDAFKVFDGEVGDTLNAKLEEIGIVNLGYGENGYRHVTNNIKPIMTPADLSGIKIRTMENPIHMASFKAFGANPTPISFNELFTALQQKTVDAQENPIAIIYTSKLYEVQKYLSLTGHVYTNCPYLISKTFLDSMPEDLQQIVKDAATDTIVEQRKMTNQQEKDLISKLEESGMIINELTPEQKEEFIKAAEPVYEDFIAKNGSELLDKIRNNQ